MSMTLVTGGAGFIGSNLAKRLLDRGHDVRILDNLSSGFRSNLTCVPQAQLIVGDIRDPSIVSYALRDVEIVFHLAASVGNVRSIEHSLIDAETNVIGTLNLLEAARRIGVRKFVYSSSAAIFGELKTLPIHEDHPCEPDSPYGASKLCAEKMCLSFAKIYDLEIIALRYFNVFGVGQRYDAYGNVIPIFAKRLLSGEPLNVYGDGEQTRDFINVGDVAMANVLAGENHGCRGAFNLGSGRRITINELIRQMHIASNIEPKVVHQSARKGEVRHSLADISAISRALNFRPDVDFVFGLSQYFEWARRACDTTIT